MKYTETTISRIFVLRLEHGDKLPDLIEEFAREKGIKNGCCIYLGGVQDHSEVVVGPEKDTELPPVPMHLFLSGMHEVAGLGTIFPDEDGNPRLHSHAALGRQDKTITGCIHPGILTWQIIELILMEFADNCGIRVFDQKTKFTLLDPRK